METSLRVTSSAISDRGLSEKRPQNEDSFLEKPELGLFAVADGVGGAQAGEVASQMAVEMLAEAFANRRVMADAEVVMRQAIEGANGAIHRMADELPQLASMATTIVALHIDGTIATIGHVGDSRLYRVDGRGNLFPETDDHSVVGEEVRAGRMTPEQAATHPSRNVISRALGAEEAVQVDLKTIMVDHGTIFLLCSDGITRHVSDQEIERVLNFSASPEDACAHLRKLCFERGAEDNLTAVVVKLSGGDAREFPLPEPDGLRENDEDTIATARTTFPDPIADGGYDEPETAELNWPPDPITPEPAEEPVGAAGVESTESWAEQGTAVPDGDAGEIKKVEGPTLLPSIVPPLESNVSAGNREDFTMFGGAADDSPPDAPSGAGRALLALVMLLIGSGIGLGVYHFALAPRSAEPRDPNLSVMRTEDIAFSSFEKNRRNVDGDPAAYIREVPPADGPEDYYLLGRAHLLVGDFQSARQAFVAAQKELSKAEPANAKVLITDIAEGLVIANDQILPPRFRQYVEDNTRAITNVQPVR
jgi:serine/threonine protein phosphatase PrpC